MKVLLSLLKIEVLFENAGMNICIDNDLLSKSSFRILECNNYDPYQGLSSNNQRISAIL
jgi:hypothetical protein